MCLLLLKRGHLQRCLSSDKRSKLPAKDFLPLSHSITYVQVVTPLDGNCSHSPEKVISCS